MQTLYQKIGPENLQKLVDVFYEQVYASEKIAHLFTNDVNEIKQKQYMFLTQFLGGPQLYNDHFGHPRMRMRHLPHQITPESKVEWLRCMKYAVSTLEIEQELKEALYNCFPQVAQHMVNSED